MEEYLRRAAFKSTAYIHAILFNTVLTLLFIKYSLPLLSMIVVISPTSNWYVGRIAAIPAMKISSAFFTTLPPDLFLAYPSYQSIKIPIILLCQLLGVYSSII